MGLEDIASFVYVGVLIHSSAILIVPILLPYCIMLEVHYIVNSQCIF